MSQGPSPLREKPLLVSRPKGESGIVLAFKPGMRLVLEFEPDQATISRDQDSLVFSLDTHGTVTIAGFFGREESMPSFTLPDGTLVAAETFFDAFCPELNTAPTPDTRAHAAEEALDNAIEGVQGLGALGTFYWGDGRLPSVDDIDALDDPDMRMGVHQMDVGKSSGTSYLEAHSNYAALVSGVGGMETIEVSPGGYAPGETYRASIPLPGSDTDWEVSGALTNCQTSDGEEKTGLAATADGENPFEDSGFDIESFIRDQSGLADWELGTDTFGCVTREVAVAENAADATISIAWSMLATEKTVAASDVAIALLFTLGSDDELVYADHTTLAFNEQNADGTFRDAFGQVSWDVEAGKRYAVSLVMAGKNSGGAPGPLLVVDAMEQAWQTDPVWVEPVYEEAPVVVYSALGNVIDDPLHAGTSAHTAEQAPGVDHHSGGLAFFVTRFLLNGEWHQTNGEAVDWKDDHGVAYMFAMSEQGEYSFSMRGANAASSEPLDIVYEIESADGLKDQATLYLRGTEQESGDFAANDPGITGAETEDASHGAPVTPDPSAIDDDASPAGDGTATALEAQPDGSEADANAPGFFFIAESDRLFFEGLLSETEDLETLLASGGLTLSGQGDALALDIASDSGENRHIDVAAEKGAMESFVNDYTHQNGTTEGLEQALLQIILCGA